MKTKGLPASILGLEESPDIGRGNILFGRILVGVAAAKAADREDDREDADINADEAIAAFGILPIGVACQLFPSHAFPPS